MSLQASDEAGQQPSGRGQFVPEKSTQLQVVREILLQRTHGTILGVEGGRSRILMPQDLADRNQTNALAEQFTCQCAPEPVRPNVGQTCMFTGPLNNMADQIGTDRSARSPAGQEHMNGVTRIPAKGKVGYQRFDDFRRQRQPVLPARLAADHQFTGTPVHVTQFHPSTLLGCFHICQRRSHN